MEYIEFYYNNLQQIYYFNEKPTTMEYIFNPDIFLARWKNGDISPVISYDDFFQSIKDQFNGDTESLYILCLYIYSLINESYFLKLRPSAKEIIDELDKMGEIHSISLTDNAGKTISINTTYIIKEILKTIRNNKNENEYETEELTPISSVANNLYLQSNFVMNLANFFNQYFKIKRKKDSLVSTEEQKLILRLLYLFKLSPVELTGSRFRQFKMCFDKFKFVSNFIRLPKDKEGKRVIVPVTMLKWKQWKDGRIDFLSNKNEDINDGTIVNFEGL